jgi:hypothetical protein
MDNDLSKYPADRYVDRIMRETRNKSKKNDSSLSFIFSTVECLR